MVRGRWTIPVPPPEAELVLLRVGLAPLLGGDGDGCRLGCGGGHFDRRLGALDPCPVAIGVGLQSARLGTIRAQPHDVGLSAIVTETGVQFDGTSGPA